MHTSPKTLSHSRTSHKLTMAGRFVITLPTPHLDGEAQALRFWPVGHFQAL
jgi:hypothetical protein